MGMVAEPLSISALSVLTGMGRRTVGHRLGKLEPVREKGNAKLYHPPDALKAIYLGGDPQAELKVSHEDARLKKARADKVEMENAVARRELIPADEVVETWVDFVTACRSRLLAIPTGLAPHLVGRDKSEISAAVKAAVVEALEELKDYDPESNGD